MVVMGSVGLCWKPELYYQRGPAPRNLQEAWDDVSLREVDDAMFNRQCLIVSSGGGVHQLGCADHSSRVAVAGLWLCYL